MLIDYNDLVNHNLGEVVRDDKILISYWLKIR